MTTAIVLAGGLGTRLREVVSDVPKPMAPINGRPFLEYLLDYWINQGINKFILAVGYKHQIIIDHFKNKYKDVNIDYSIESVPLGTGGGLMSAVSKLETLEPFLILNGDTYFAISLKSLIKTAIQSDADWCIAAFRTREEQRYTALQVSISGRIVNLNAIKSNVGDLVNGGVYWVNPRSLADHAKATPRDFKSLEIDILPKFVEIGQRLFACEFNSTFVDIGVPQDYLSAGALIVG